MAKIKKKVGIIGAGNMGGAIAGALIGSDISDPSSIYISDIDKGSLSRMGKTYDVKTTTDNFDVFMMSDVVILAVKPQIMNEALLTITGHEGYCIKERKLVVSIAAGIRISKIERLFYGALDDRSKKNLPVIRVMPNTPALVLSGMSGMSGNTFATAEDIRLARMILEGMGKVIEFKEEDLDAVTALSGSGPAYVFYLAEAMIEAGIKLGLDPNDAMALSMETLKGAVKLLETQDESPEQLRKRVTSPGGTTEAAFRVLENNRVKDTIIEAIFSAAERSKELSR